MRYQRLAKGAWIYIWSLLRVVVFLLLLLELITIAVSVPGIL